MSRIHFGTGGFRAIIGDGFTRENIELLVAGLIRKMQREQVTASPVIIGYDRRFLSDVAARWACEVFAAGGVHVKLIDQESPTPLIMFVVKRTGARYGLAVTASHNPAIYNGVKVFTAGGRDADESVTDDLEAEIDRLQPQEIQRMEFEQAVSAGMVEIIYPQNEYIDSILSVLNVGAIKARHLRVLLDPMYGVSRTSLQTVLLTCRCDVDIINDRHDTLFGGRLPAPSAQTLKRLSDMVVEGHYDMGLGTDGDADRIGLIDSEGRFIHPNDILVLLYYYLVKYKGWRGDAVRNIATTHLLDRLAESFGQTCYEVPVGFKHISSKMEQTDALIGGESSGGLTVRGHIKGKDGIYAAALLVEMVSVIGKPLSEILGEIHRLYGNFAMSEYDCRFDAATKERLQKLLFEEKRLPEFPYEVEKVSYADGCKVYFKNGGWIICRFSGTEPLIRIFCEMDQLEKAGQLTRTMCAFLGLRE